MLKKFQKRKEKGKSFIVLCCGLLQYYHYWKLNWYFLTKPSKLSYPLGIVTMHCSQRAN